MRYATHDPARWYKTHNWQFDDGGRKAAGYEGLAPDCAVRAICIVTGQPYVEVRRALLPRWRRWLGKEINGVWWWRLTRYLRRFGWEYLDLRAASPSSGKLKPIHRMDDVKLPPNAIVHVEGHTAAVVEGVQHDTGPCNTGELVYGYFYHADDLPLAWLARIDQWRKIATKPSRLINWRRLFYATDFAVLVWWAAHYL